MSEFVKANVTNNTAFAATQVGTARVRSIDWDASSGNTAYPDTNHSNYRLYLWDVNTSNNIFILHVASCYRIRM